MSELFNEAKERKLVLDFLQENGLSLYQTYPDLIEAKLGENPVRLVMVMTTMPVNKPANLEYRDMKIAVEVLVHTNAVAIQADGNAQKVEFVKDSEFHGKPSPPVLEEQHPASEIPEPLNMAEAVHHPFSPEEMKALGISETIGPQSVTAKDPKAFEAWKARFKAPNK